MCHVYGCNKFPPSDINFGLFQLFHHRPTPRVHHPPKTHVNGRPPQFQCQVVNTTAVLHRMEMEWNGSSFRVREREEEGEKQRIFCHHRSMLYCPETAAAALIIP